MTNLEKEAYEILVDIQHYLLRGKISRIDYKDLVGHVRDIIAHFNNFKTGCHTGVHVHKCTCKAAVRGYSDENLKYHSERYRFPQPAPGREAGGDHLK